MEKPRKMILDCPFCGEQPEKATAITPRGIIYFLECTNDKCPAHTVSVCGDHFEQSSINKWNTRAMSTWIAEELGKEIYSQLLNHARHTVIDGSDACIVINPITQSPKIAKKIREFLTRKLTGKV